MKLIILILCFLQFSQILCLCNITALSSVNAITTNNEGKAEKHYGVNFNLMDKYKVIYVINANVTEMCEGMVKFFSKLQELNIIASNIKTIEKNAFQHVPKLTKLSLAVNNLTHFQAGHVNNIKSLQVLYLSSNQLKNIEQDSFDNMTQLKRLYLNKNKLESINGNWFQNCPSLHLIDLSHNQITTIPPKAFVNIQPSVMNHFVNYRLGYNQISTVSSNAIDSNKENLLLWLEGNRLLELPVSVFENLKQIHSLILNSNNIACLDNIILGYLKIETISLQLEKNPIQCDCLKKFDKFVEDNAIQADFRYNTVFNCKLLEQTPILIQ